MGRDQAGWAGGHFRAVEGEAADDCDDGQGPHDAARLSGSRNASGEGVANPNPEPNPEPNPKPNFNIYPKYNPNPYPYQFAMTIAEIVKNRFLF